MQAMLGVSALTVLGDRHALVSIWTRLGESFHMPLWCTDGSKGQGSEGD